MNGGTPILVRDRRLFFVGPRVGSRVLRSGGASGESGREKEPPGVGGCKVPYSCHSIGSRPFAIARHRRGLLCFRAPEILFIERCFQFLKPGKGKLGIVVPDGVLGNPDNEYIRYWIMASCQVLASVDLPVETFLPRTGTQTSVLILRRKSEQEKLAESLSGEAPEYPIFMAIARSVGKDRRGGFVHLRDQDGREVLRRDLYETYKNSTLLDFAPAVEPGGRVVDDELPKIAELFAQFRSKQSHQGAR